MHILKKIKSGVLFLFFLFAAQAEASAANFPQERTEAAIDNKVKQQTREQAPLPLQENFLESYYKQKLKNDHFNEGKELFDKEKYEEAISCFKHALEFDPQYKPALIYIKSAEEQIDKENKIQEEKAVVAEVKARLGIKERDRLRNEAFQEGKTFFGRTNYREAAASFKRALEYDQVYKPALKYLELSEEKIAQQDKLAQEKALAKNKAREAQEKLYSRDSAFQEGKYLFERANYPEALTSFEKALKYDPVYKPALDYVELCAERIAQQNKLAEDKSRAEKKKQEAQERLDSRNKIHEEGVNLFNRSQYSEAIESFRRALEYDPQYKPALNYIKLSEDKISQQDKFAEEMALAEKKKKEVQERLDSRNKTYEEGVNLFNKSQYPEAIESFKKALEHAPRDKSAINYIKLSENKISQQNKLAEERALAEKKKKEAQEKFDLRNKFYEEGVSLFNKSQYPEAIESFKKTLEYDPRNKSAINYIKLCEDKSAEKNKIREEKILSQMRENKLPQEEKNMQAPDKADLLEAERERKRKLLVDKAKEDLERKNKLIEEKALAEKRKKEQKEKEDLRDVYYNEGKNLFNKAKYPEAIEKFNQALESFPQYKPAMVYIELAKDKIFQEDVAIKQNNLREAYYNEGKNLFNKGEYLEAAVKFKQALENDPKYEPAIRFLELTKDTIAGQKKLEEEKILTEQQKQIKREKENLRNTYYSEGKEFFNKAKYSEAIAKFKQALENDSAYEPAVRFIELARDRIAQQNRLSEESMVADQRKKDQKEREDLKEMYFNEGKRLFENAKYREAIIKFSQVLEYYDLQYKPAIKYIKLAQEKIDSENKILEEKASLEQRKQQELQQKQEIAEARKVKEELKKKNKLAEENILVDKKKRELQKKQELRDGAYNEGKGLFDKGNFLAAVVKLKQALEYEPGYKPAENYLKLAEDKILQEKRLREKKIERKPPEPTEKEKGELEKKAILIDIYYTEGKEFFEKNKYKEAIAKFNHILEYYDPKFELAIKYIELAKEMLLLRNDNLKAEETPEKTKNALPAGEQKKEKPEIKSVPKEKKPLTEKEKKDLEKKTILKEIFYNEGKEFYEKGQYREAVAKLRHILEYYDSRYEPAIKLLESANNEISIRNKFGIAY